MHFRHEQANGKIRKTVGLFKSLVYETEKQKNKSWENYFLVVSR